MFLTPRLGEPAQVLFLEEVSLSILDDKVIRDCVPSAFGPPLPGRQRLDIWRPRLVFKSSAVRDLLLVLFLDLVNLSHLQLVSLDVARSSVLIALVIADVLLEVDD